MKLNIARIETENYVCGPGRQFVIWVQGCSIHCKGCWNQVMWPFEKRTLLDVKELFDLVKEQKNIDGVTILGGEPLDQPEAILEFCRDLKSSDMGITLYTGYEQEQIIDPIRQDILKNIDILICGPYQEELRDINTKWIGSKNQRIIKLTERYKGLTNEDANYCEIDISIDGKITGFGFPDDKLIKKMEEMIYEPNIRNT